MEYYIALRKKTEKPDPSAESALMDLQPYAVIAAEQAIGRKDYIEAERLRALIAAADPQAPSLARIADAIAKGKVAARRKPPPPKPATADEAAAAEAARLKAIADAKVAAEAEPGRRRCRRRPAAAGARRCDPGRAAAAAGHDAAPEPLAVPPPPPPAAAPARAARRPGRDSDAATGLSAGGDGVRHSGEVTVAPFTVNADGSVGNINIITAKPRGVFERGVQSAVRNMALPADRQPQNGHPHLRLRAADSAKPRATK